jgi:hypothetical protein
MMHGDGSIALSDAKKKLADDHRFDVYREMTAAERIAIVDVLTRQAWAFREGFDPESRLRRDVVRVIRGRL